MSTSAVTTSATACNSVRAVVTLASLAAALIPLSASAASTPSLIYSWSGYGNYFSPVNGYYYLNNISNNGASTASITEVLIPLLDDPTNPNYLRGLFVSTPGWSSEKLDRNSAGDADKIAAWTYDGSGPLDEANYIAPSAFVNAPFFIRLFSLGADSNVDPGETLNFTYISDYGNNEGEALAPFQLTANDEGAFILDPIIPAGPGYTAAAVPEPGSAVMLVVTGALALSRRRRRA